MKLALSSIAVSLTLGFILLVNQTVDSSPAWERFTYTDRQFPIGNPMVRQGRCVIVVSESSFQFLKKVGLDQWATGCPEYFRRQDEREMVEALPEQ